MRASAELVLAMLPRFTFMTLLITGQNLDLMAIHSVQVWLGDMDLISRCSAQIGRKDTFRFIQRC